MGFSKGTNSVKNPLISIYSLKIIIDNYIPYIKGALDRVAEVEYLSYKEITPLSVKDADALIIRTRTRCDMQLLKGSKVKFIASATIGYDHIDATYCKDNGIFWTNAPGCNAVSVAQYIASALYFIFERNKLCPEKLTLGVVGVGAVGSKIASLGESMGMRVLRNDPPRAEKEGPEGFCDLDTIAQEADIISFHTLLTKDGKYPSFHLADLTFFESLKKKAIVMNASRGEVVDNMALKSAINRKLVGEVVLDCWENEPNIDRELLYLTTLATPHIAGYSADGKSNAAMQSVRSLSRFFNLGLNFWEVPQLEEPLDIDFNYPTSFSSFLQDSYQIEADSLRLKFSPDTFENQRSHYPFRREPKAYLSVMNDTFREEFCKKFPLFAT